MGIVMGSDTATNTQTAASPGRCTIFLRTSFDEKNHIPFLFVHNKPCYEPEQ